MLEIEINNQDELHNVCPRIIEFIGDDTIVLLEGVMGSGKTTLTKALCSAINVEDNVNSPTYSIANEYKTTAGKTVYHFDFYRLEQEEEALDIGIEEYFYSGDLCFIEWSERVLNLIPDRYIRIDITPDDSGKRLFKLSTHG